MEHRENSVETIARSGISSFVPDLNSDCLELIFNYLCFRDLCSVAQTCRRYAEVARSSFRAAHKGTVILTPSECAIERIRVFFADIINLYLMESLEHPTFDREYCAIFIYMGNFTDKKFKEIV